MRGIEFVNDLRCNYLTIPYEGGEEDFALRMMTENATDAFLPVELRRLDGQTYLYYNISGMQNMEVLYGEKPIDRKTFQEFIWQLHAAIEESGELFLPGDGICLEPAALFWELGTGRWKFLYVPGKDAEKQEEMRGERENFAEFLATHMDYEDRELAETVYRFYEEICAGVNFSWGDLPSWGSAQRAEPQEAENEFSERDIKDEKTERGEDGDLRRYVLDGGAGAAMHAGERGGRGAETESEAREMEEDWGTAEGGEKRKPRVALYVLLCAVIAMTLVSGKVAPGMALYGSAAVGAIAIVLSVIFMRRRKRDARGEEAHEAGHAREEPPEEFFWQPKDKEAECGERRFAAEERTVYMEIEDRQERKLYGVGKQRRQKIFLENLPCLAGKDKTLADHVIADPSVSRMHAKFWMDGEKIWMQDLNSTNGTFHNGMRLRPNERVALEPEDEVGFGQAQFVFR